MVFQMININIQIYVYFLVSGKLIIGMGFIVRQTFSAISGP